jgi:ribosomal protein S12 methylthiotransferase accessory factor
MSNSRPAGIHTGSHAGGHAECAMHNFEQIIQAVTSPRTGIINAMSWTAQPGDDGILFEPAVSVANCSLLPGMQSIAQPGGAALHRSDALARGVFETIERYCLAFVDPYRLYLGQAQGEAFFHAPVQGLYTPGQYARKGFPFRPWPPGSSIQWVDGRCLLSGKPRMVPAACVFVPYRTTNQDEWFGPSVSTGAAVGWSWQQACLGGILEVCERDAFAMTWLHRLSRPHILLDAQSELARTIEAYRRRTHAEVHLIDLTNDLQVPVALAVIRRTHHGRTILTLGASAKGNLYAACEKAFAEAFSGYHRLLWQLEHHPNWRPAPDGSNLTDWEWHGFAYAFDEYLPKADFLTAADDHCTTLVNPPPPDHQAFTLNQLTQSLRHQFDEIVAVDLTTREIAELGLVAVKVIIPAAIPLSPDHRFQWLTSQRLRNTQRKHDGGPSNAHHMHNTSNLNTDPHPFA